MFERFSSTPRALARHREGPTVEERQKSPIYRGNGGTVVRNTLPRSAQSFGCSEEHRWREDHS